MRRWANKPELVDAAELAASRLGIRPSWLLSVIEFETAGTFSPAVRNMQTNATGLIQFMPSTATRLNTTIEALAKMTVTEQMQYVTAYLAPWKSKLGALEDLYMTVLWPLAVDKPLDYVLFARPTEYYTRNAGLDLDRDGKVTKAEAAARVCAIWAQRHTTIT